MRQYIRPMTQNDIDDVYLIELASHLAPWSRSILSDCVFVGYDCRVLEIMADRHPKIVGYIICRKKIDTCHILNVCVAKSEQRKGYGKLLLTDVLESLVPPYNTVILEVRPSNQAALKVYQTFDFQHDSIKEAYYHDGQGNEDAIVLKKILAPSKDTSTS